MNMEFKSGDLQLFKLPSDLQNTWKNWDCMKKIICLPFLVLTHIAFCQEPVSVKCLMNTVKAFRETEYFCMKGDTLRINLEKIANKTFALGDVYLTDDGRYIKIDIQERSHIIFYRAKTSNKYLTLSFMANNQLPDFCYFSGTVFIEPESCEVVGSVWDKGIVD